MLERNIQALSERRKRDEVQATLQERVAEAITRFTGSMVFVYLHLAFFGFWIIANLGWIPGVPQWDDSFVVLAMWASVEAIFLSTFVLISQNRMQAAADKRADLDLQISLLAEDPERICPEGRTVANRGWSPLQQERPTRRETRRLAGLKVAIAVR